MSHVGLSVLFIHHAKWSDLFQIKTKMFDCPCITATILSISGQGQVCENIRKSFVSCNFATCGMVQFTVVNVEHIYQWLANCGILLLLRPLIILKLRPRPLVDLQKACRRHVSRLHMCPVHTSLVSVYHCRHGRQADAITLTTMLTIHTLTIPVITHMWSSSKLLMAHTSTTHSKSIHLMPTAFTLQ